MFKNNLLTAWRNLRKQKVHSLINIAGLSAGIAVVLLISLWLWDEVSFDRQFPNYDKIAQVMQNQVFSGEVHTWKNVALPLAPALRKDYGSNFKYLVRAGWTGTHLFTVGNKKISASGDYMEPQVSDMLSLTMRQGSKSGLTDMHSIFLAASTAKAFFGDVDGMNKIIRIDDQSFVRVTGIYDDLPANSSFADLNFIAPWDLMVQDQHLNEILHNPWGASWFQTFAQVADHTTIEAVSQKIKNVKKENISAEEAGKNKPVIFLQPMRNWHLYSEFKNGVVSGGRIQYVWLFGITGLFVLLLACINFMNLSTARSEKRAKEVGVRKTMGSSRAQLMGQFFTESILVVGLAFVFSLLLAQLSLPFFNSVSGKQVHLPWASAFFWLGGVFFVLVTGIIAGSYPALYLSSFQPVKVLKGVFRAGRFAGLPRKVLVVTQFTVSVVIVVGTIVVYRQLDFAKNRPVGYNRNGLVTISTGKMGDHFEAFRQELLKTGTVVELAESSSKITDTYITNSGLDWRGKDPAMQEEFTTVSVTPGFGKTIGWEIIEGRDFSKDFATDSSAIILNEAAVKYIGIPHPVGETIKWGKNAPVHVIGVVKNMVTQNPYDPIKQTFFHLLSFGFLDHITLKINPNTPAATAIRTIAAVSRKYNPDQPFSYKFADDDYAVKFDNEERVGKLATAFAMLAIFISCLGLFGMASYAAEQRIREIGVRKVLGASVFTLWRLLSGEFVFLIFLSLCVALPLSYYLMHQWLQQYNYRASITGWVLALPSVGAFVLTLLTVSYQACKAALTNPVKSLRTD